MGYEQITGPNSIAPTPPSGDISNRVATTTFVSTTVSAAVAAAIAGIVFPPVALTSITNSLSSDHLLNNTGTYFDGPSVAQGSSGVWFASGTVTVLDTAGGSLFSFRLWDGTNIMASGRDTGVSASNPNSVSLSGVITNPVGNIRISVKDTLTTTGKMVFNASGDSKDCTITVIRIV